MEPNISELQTHNYHLAGSSLELSQVPLGVPGPHFGNHWASANNLIFKVLYMITFRQMCGLLASVMCPMDFHYMFLEHMHHISVSYIAVFLSCGSHRGFLVATCIHYR